MNGAERERQMKESLSNCSEQLRRDTISPSSAHGSWLEFQLLEKVDETHRPSRGFRNKLERFETFDNSKLKTLDIKECGKRGLQSKKDLLKFLHPKNFFKNINCKRNSLGEFKISYFSSKGLQMNEQTGKAQNIVDSETSELY